MKLFNPFDSRNEGTYMKLIKCSYFFLLIFFGCSKGLNLTGGDKKISRNPYEGTEKETPPSDISGAWLTKCRVTELSKGTFQVQCRLEGEAGVKYPKAVEVSYRQANGSVINGIATKQLPSTDFYHFEAKIETTSPVEIIVKPADNSFVVKAIVILNDELGAKTLAGLLTGVCGYQGPQDSGCNLVQESLPDSKCPDGYSFVQMTSRFQGPNGRAIEGNNSGTCVLDQASNPTTLEDPKKFAYKGAAYGFCKTSTDTKRCIDSSARAPMSPNNDCPEGFSNWQISAHVDGSTNFRTFTCVANETGSAAEPPRPGAIIHLKNYDFRTHNDSSERQRCPSGMEWTPISGRHLGQNEQWVSGCVVK